MNLFDKLTLLVTGLTAIFLVWRFYGDLKAGARPARSVACYITSFSVLLVSGLLLIGLGYGILENRLVVVVASFIPVALSLGLISEYAPSYEKIYGAFAVIGMLALTATRFAGPRTLGLITLIIVHSVAGLIIFGLPLWYGFKDLAPRPFAWVGVGGALIGIGGIALAFLKLGMPILPASFIFMILAPLLLLMTASFAFGFVRGTKR